MTDEHLQGLLDELRDQFPSGVVCIAYPDAPEKLYYWWGDRTLCLGHTARLTNGINQELDQAESVGPSHLAEESVHFGQYL